MVDTLEKEGKGKALKGFFIVFSVCLIVNFFANGVQMDSWRDVYFQFVGTITSVMIWYGCAFIADAYPEQISWTEKPYLRLSLSISATAVWVFLVYFFTRLCVNIILPDFSLLKVIHSLKFQHYLFTFLITIMISSFLYGRGFFFQWKAKFEESEKHKEEKLLYQYEMLRNQVNPHFLFNNLSVLSTLVHKDPDLAEAFIAKFANVYRYVLDSRMKETVSIQEELSHLEDYLFLMKIRFGEGFTFQSQVTDDMAKVLPMTLQMLIENVFKHNNVSKSEPLSILITQREDYLVVQNKLVKRNHVEASGIGLENIKERYRHLTEKPIIIKEDGEFFTVEIPFI